MMELTILKKIEIEHQAIRAIMEIAEILEEEVGDRTNAAIVIADELLKNAEDLLSLNQKGDIIKDFG